MVTKREDMVTKREDKDLKSLSIEELKEYLPIGAAIPKLENKTEHECVIEVVKRILKDKH